jgi:cytoskeletal protein CcmA (bactofilin family)
MWMKTVATIGLMLLAINVAAQQEQGDEVVQHSMGADLFVAGDSVSVSEAVTGDLIAAGGDLSVSSSVGGDLVIAGGNINLTGPVSEGLYAAGGSIAVDADIARNARVAGGSVSLGPGSHVAGNATLAGGRITVRGPIDGYLQAGGGRIYLDGRVGGDVELAGDRIELGPNARIEGRLRYDSRQDIQQAAGAEVQGGIERVKGIASAHGDFDRPDGRGHLGIVWSLGLVLAAALLAGVWPTFADRIGSVLPQRFAWSVLVGFIALVCTPVLVILLLVTVIGIPLALTALAAYGLLLLAGYITSGVGVGTFALHRWKDERATSTAWRVGAAALGMLLVVVVGRLPWLGWLVVLVALLFGMGALLMQLRRSPA